MKTTNRYQSRGVSAEKHEIHEAIKNVDAGLFPGAFCKITPDFISGDPNLCNIIHADGSGTKSILAYLHYRETGDASCFHGIAQDSIVMNLDDLACVGATDKILFSSTINRNARRCPGEVISAIVEGTEAFLAELRGQGLELHGSGGETADVGDLTGTILVDTTAVAVLPKQRVINAANIIPGLIIIGLGNDVNNSGIGSNGLTSARHELLSKYYAEKYPETFDSNINSELVYCGPYQLTDQLPNTEMSIGEALLSPAKTHAPFVHKMLKEIKGVMGLIHCSGGGQTKCLNFGRGIHFIKDTLFPIPAIFQEIQRVSKTSWREMYQVFNMGHRFEIYCGLHCVDEVIQLANDFGIAAQVIGYTDACKNNCLTISDGKNSYNYGEKLW